MIDNISIVYILATCLIGLVTWQAIYGYTLEKKIKRLKQKRLEQG